MGYKLAEPVFTKMGQKSHQPTGLRRLFENLASGNRRGITANGSNFYRGKVIPKINESCTLYRPPSTSNGIAAAGGDQVRTQRFQQQKP